MIYDSDNRTFTLESTGNTYYAADGPLTWFVANDNLDLSWLDYGVPGTFNSYYDGQGGSTFLSQAEAYEICTYLTSLWSNWTNNFAQ